MTWVEYTVIGAYLVLLLAVGWIFKNFNKDTSDFLRGGCRATWWLVGSSVFMQLFSAWTFTGAAGVAYESGFSVMIIYLSNALGFFINFLFVGEWLRRLRATTAPEVINLRFGPATQKFYALMIVPTRLLYSSIHLYGLGIFCSAVFGYDIRAVIVVIGIVVLIYSTSGGRWAVMATDYLQGLILVPLTVLVAVLCLYKIGGIGAFFQAIENQGLVRQYKIVNDWEMFAGAYTWGWLAAMMLKQVITYNTLNAAPRYFSVKDGPAAKKAALLAMCLMLAGACFWFIPPMTARLLFEEEVMLTMISKPAEASYAIASFQVLPSGLTGLIVVAILTATMSSMDTGLNINAAILLRDLYPSYCKLRGKEPASEDVQLKIARVYSFILGALIISLAWYFSQQEDKGIFVIMLDIGALLATPMAIPVFWGLFIRRTPWWAGFSAIGCAFVPSFFAFFSEPFFGQEWTFQMKLIPIVLAGSFGFFISIPFAHISPDSYNERLEEFFRRLRTPVDFEKEVGQANDTSQLNILGKLGLAIACFVLSMVLLPNPMSGRLVILLLAFTIGLISCLLIWASRRPAQSLNNKTE